MKASDFLSSSTGQLVPTTDGQLAFVPAPLPPAIEYDTDLVLRLSHADAALSELAGVGRHLPNPHLLISPYVRREAILSTRIEGTQASFEELLREEINETSPSEDADIREVRNYITALEYGIERLVQLPISLRLVCELHERILAGVRGENTRPGSFRDRQNYIGRPGTRIQDATFVPPPPPEMMEALYTWEPFVHEKNVMPDLIQCALIHHQFETIHPFIDGNGRLGRLLITLFLIERKRLSQPLLYLSAYFEQHRNDYYELLQRVRTEGDWSSWLRFFLQGVIETAGAATNQAIKLMDVREQYRQLLRGKGKALMLLDELFVNPFVTVQRAMSLMNVSQPTAQSTITLLESQGLLEEITGRAWRRMYLAVPVWQVIAPEEALTDTQTSE